MQTPASATPPGSHDGMGADALGEYIKWSENHGSEAGSQQMVDYVRENWVSLLDGRSDGGNDTLNGGAGNDMLVSAAPATTPLPAAQVQISLYSSPTATAVKM